ncbi:hypothetical protein [Halopiger xanaduensis]|uniref:Uncharacterized protein n=1 Tax=Halopiger xanaduensis (strain DSM 18323 / JCM 14033 / SH-6) TaxID=797210 RepID=F8D997_HALXS|nr:hypothetical protein [Halopiger xanaduensis]AEH36833.1 hypothetical protein Halxa_2208 [Halopiger xanaduensis SH-6]
MSSSVVVLLIAALLIQFPIAALVYLDARRLDLERATMYALGILSVPLAGWVVVLWYLSQRSELPRADEATVDSD